MKIDFFYIFILYRERIIGILKIFYIWSKDSRIRLDNFICVWYLEIYVNVIFNILFIFYITLFL